MTIWIVVALMAIAAAIVLWRRDANRRAHAAADDLARRNLAGSEAVVTRAMNVGAQGEVALLGTHWQAINRGTQPVEAKQRVEVIDVVGMLVSIRGRDA